MSACCFARSWFLAVVAAYDFCGSRCFVLNVVVPRGFFFAVTFFLFQADVSRVIVVLTKNALHTFVIYVMFDALLLFSCPLAAP